MNCRHEKALPEEPRLLKNGRFLFITIYMQDYFYQRFLIPDFAFHMFFKNSSAAPGER